MLSTGMLVLVLPLNWLGTGVNGSVDQPCLSTSSRFFS